MDSLPLMHGIPISVKDLLNQKGFLSTVGCAFLCNDRAEDDGAIVKLYLKHGAIPIVRGNCPQSALSLHTDNLIFGEAKNPH
jgi:Asp-tRNA(Asn)/Glu-tRNA(Gln) amidotransferase A subunit family amidase